MLTQASKTIMQLCHPQVDIFYHCEVQWQVQETRTVVINGYKCVFSLFFFSCIVIFDTDTDIDMYSWYS